MTIQFELRHIEKRYAGKSVISDFDLEITTGEFVAITGPSGAGKSTLLNILGLLESPDGGSLQIFGEPAPRPGSKKSVLFLRSRLCYLFQNFALIEKATVRENLEIALVYSPHRSKSKALIKEALTSVGLAGIEDRRAYTLSGGEQQRVALARILVKQCDVILADEPTGSLDEENRDIVMGHLQRMNDEGRTVIIATHDDSTITQCDRKVATSQLLPACQEND